MFLHIYIHLVINTVLLTWDVILCQAAKNLSVETLEKGVLTPKSNVWSFGVVLLELITGRKNLDVRSSKEERNIVKWSRPFLTDDSRLSLIMDPRIKRFPTKAAWTVASIRKPTMRAVVETLASVQDIKVPCRYPLQEPSAAPRKVMLKSTSLNGTVPQHPVTTFLPSPPSRNQHLVSPRSSTSALLPARPVQPLLPWITPG
jgi:serine/threonine protein kinase